MTINVVSQNRKKKGEFATLYEGSDIVEARKVRDAYASKHTQVFITMKKEPVCKSCVTF